MEANVPVIGERWLVMRPEIYRQIAEQPAQVTSEEITDALTALGGGEQIAKVQLIRNYVAKGREIDEGSFHQAVTRVIKEQSFSFEVNGVTTAVPKDTGQILVGTLSKKKAPPPAPQTGRTIVIQGTLASHNDMGPFFKRILQPIASQQPDELTIEICIRAHFDKDPGSGLDATLDDGFDNDAFPGLRREDHPFQP